MLSPSNLKCRVHRLPRPRARANVCQPRVRAPFPEGETSSETQEALLQQPSAWSQKPHRAPVGSSLMKKRGSWSQVLVGSADHTTNSGSTSAERKRGLGGRATTACLPMAAERSPPRGESPLCPRGATAGTAGCLRGRPRPRLAGGESGPARLALPFSAAENLFGAMRAAAAKERKKKRSGKGWTGRACVASHL